MEYLNELQPPGDQPLRPSGVSYPVIIRLVCADGTEEWRPGKSVKWTATGAVLVGWEETPGDPRSMTHAWLSHQDVARVLRRPPTADVGPDR